MQLFTYLISIKYARHCARHLRKKMKNTWLFILYKEGGSLYLVDAQ